MDQRTFIASLFRALAWPVLAFIFVTIFRKEISNWLGRIKSVKFFNSEVSLEPLVADAAENLPSDPGIERASKAAVEVKLEGGKNPAEVIVESWNNLVSSFREVGSEKELGDGRGVFRDPQLIGRKLPLPEDVQASLGKLRLVKDDILRGNGSAYMRSDAVNYAKACELILTALRNH